MYATNIEPLKVVQNSIIKIILQKPRRYSTNLLYSEELCNVSTLYILTVCTYIHRNLNKQTFFDHIHQTRGNLNKNIITPKSKRNINQHSSIYLGPKFYNALPRWIREKNPLKKFNKWAKDYIIKNLHLFLRFL